MTPPQKQPAVTEDELIAAYCHGDVQLRKVAKRLLTERDEAIREVERLRTEIETKPISYTGQVTKLINEHERIKAELERLKVEASEDLARHLIQADATIMAEKRRTATYRHRLTRMIRGVIPNLKAIEAYVDLEAPSDSGGEKIVHEPDYSPEHLRVCAACFSRFNQGVGGGKV